MSLLRLLLPIASLSLAIVACSGQIAPVLTSPDGGEDAGPSPDAGPQPQPDGSAPDGGACPGDERRYYRAPGCGADAVGVCSGPPPPCAEEYCSCNGKTVIGCGVVSEPFAYKGPCTDAGPADVDTCTPAGGTCAPIGDCARGQGQLGGPSYSCGIGAPGTNTCCFKSGTPCGDAPDFDCCTGGGASRPYCQLASGTLACYAGTMMPVGTCP